MKKNNDNSFIEVRNYLDNAIKEKGFTYRELSLGIGRRDSYLHRFIKYGLPRHLDESDRHKLAAILEIDEKKLTDKDFTAFPVPSHMSGVSMVAEKIASLFKKDEVAIDILNVSACCGGGLEVDSEDVVGKFVMSNDDFRAMSLTSSPKNVKMIKAVGDSMSPTINDGDWCFVDVSLNSAISDGIYLIKVKSVIAIKRLQNDFAGNVVIKSDNACYDTTNVNLTDVNIIGRVIYILNGRKV